MLPLGAHAVVKQLQGQYYKVADVDAPQTKDLGSCEAYIGIDQRL